MSCVNRHQVSAAVELAVDVVLFKFAFGYYRQVEIDMSVTGVQSNVCRQISGNFQGYIAVAGVRSPLPGDTRPCASPRSSTIEHEAVVGIAQRNLDSIAVLMLLMESAIR
jgi:hypothetical protein